MLQGLRVLDFTRVLAGPYCTAMLADLGAEVIKVEPPQGDDQRHMGRMVQGESTNFILNNRGKKSVRLDLKHAEGQRIARELAARSDVVIENFKPGVADRLGIGYAELAGRKPDLVYCSISGFGQNGPHAGRPSYDVVAQAMSGMMSLTGEADGAPTLIGESVGDICAGRTLGGSEVLHVKAEGPERFVQVTVARGRGDHATAVLSDASALKTLEAQFVQSQKMQAIGQLAGGIAHDFNNLLTAITGHCDLLMLRHDKADPDYADLDQISQNANRAAALVRQLLAFSRKQTLKPQIMDLRDTLSDLTHLLNRLVGERIVLTFDHDPSLRMIRADRRQLEQVIMNLVVNARDAMPEGGDITVSTDNVRLDSPSGVGRATLPAGDYVRVQVRDQGCGIAPDDLAKIFEPFFTTKRLGEGTGLGLSTAYGIVKQTGGYIFCDSTPGEGSCFSLFFPAHDRGAVDEPAPEPAAPIRTRREVEATVLLVEDEAPVRAFASRALKLQGFNVLEAACAEDALSLLSDQRLLVDVFVTDVVMPGMDGPSWVRTALRDRPDTRVIFMSGYAEDIFSEGSPVPDAAFLAKPFSLSDLTALVTRQLEAAH